MANSVDPDQMLHSAASDLGPHCKGLSVPILTVIMIFGSIICPKCYDGMANSADPDETI